MTSIGFVAPSLGRASFSCPHCNAHAAQTWFRALADRSGNVTPFIPGPTDYEADWPGWTGKSAAEKLLGGLQLIAWRDNMRRAEPFFDKAPDSYPNFVVSNLFFSRCFTCSRVSLWLGENLLIPRQIAAAQAHTAMPKHLSVDFEEARQIAAASPRGAAALLRLTIQKLCKVLGEPGRNLDADIGALVAKGLPRQIQQALDAVRVIGNESVHPGELDLKDDHETVQTLFDLVNLIVEDRIARPASIEAFYNKLPASKLQGIEKRDASNGRSEPTR